MNRIYRKSPFWTIAGPLLGYLIIQGGVEFLVQMGLTVPGMAESYMKLIGENSHLTADQMSKMYMTALNSSLNLLMKYSVEISSAGALGTLILSGILFKRDRQLEKKCGIMPPDRIPVSKYWMLLIIGGAGCAAVTCLMAMAAMAFYDPSYEQTAQVMYSAPVLVQIAGLGIVIPVAEEMMFRGILFRRYREKKRFWYSAVCSSLIFALIHGNMTQMIYAFLLGLMLCYLYEKYASLKAPVFLHIILNTGSVILTECGVFSWLGNDPIRLAVTAIAGAFICSSVFVRIQRISGPVTEETSEN